MILTWGCSGVVVEYRTHNREVAGSNHTRSTASNIEQIANILCAQARDVRNRFFLRFGFGSVFEKTLKLRFGSE